MRIFILTFLGKILQSFRRLKIKVLGYDNVHHTAIIESKVTLDKVNPKGVHVGKNVLIASGATILTHEHVYRDPLDASLSRCYDTVIGDNSFVGIGATILPGRIIGREVIIGAGSVVSRDIPSNSIAVGNPARVVRQGIKMNSSACIEP